MQKITRIFISLGVFLLFTTLSLAQQKRSGVLRRNELTPLEIEARANRKSGLMAQQAGQLDEAIIYYNKAIMLDPTYVEPYNDVGVVYENKGMPEIAERFYLKALELDHNYLPAYTNLAMLYENRGDFKKAAEYWRKRIKLGNPDDPWVIKGKQHLKNIALIVEEVSQQLKEEEVISLIEDVKGSFSTKKPAEKKPERKPPEPKTLSEKQKKVKEYLRRAELNLKNKDYVSALNEAAMAKHLDPADTQLDKFMENIRNELRDTYRH